MRVKLLRMVYVQGRLHASSEVVELDRETANRLVLLGAAEPLEPVGEAKVAEPIPAKGASVEPAAEPLPAKGASEEPVMEPVPAKSKRRKE